MTKTPSNKNKKSLGDRVGNVVEKIGPKVVKAGAPYLQRYLKLLNGPT